jgi:Tfp pilus assembly protein PilF
VIYYVKAIEVDPKQADVHYDLANAYFNINQVDKAIDHYREAIRLNSNRVEYFFNLGNALSLQEKYEEAIAQY